MLQMNPLLGKGRYSPILNTDGTSLWTIKISLDNSNILQLVGKLVQMSLKNEEDHTDLQNNAFTKLHIRKVGSSN